MSLNLGIPLWVYVLAVWVVLLTTIYFEIKKHGGHK